MSNRNHWYAGAWQALMATTPAAKIAALATLASDMHAPARGDPVEIAPAIPIEVPGRPERPLLVAPRELQARKLSSADGRAALVHAVAHIEFNAINLALDAIYRFRDLPDAYYLDWLSVAVDEARHFQLLAARLGELGFAYGDFPAHNGLWQAACQTAHSALMRMALVPRVLEARGLDVTPGMIERLRAAGDDRTVACLEVILREEVGHVAIGTRWYRYLCEREGITDPDQHFLRLLAEHGRGAVRPPFNEAARSAAGFSESEQAGLHQLNPSIRS